MTDVIEDLRGIANRLGPDRRPGQVEDRKMTSVLLAYSGEDQFEVSGIIEEFSQRLKKLGVDVHVASYRNERESPKQSR